MKIRPVKVNDRSQMIRLFDNISLFTDEERAVATELLDASINPASAADYLFFATEESNNDLSSFICFGPTPMTQGTYDMYWIGTDDQYTRRGLARNLVNFMKQYLVECGGRLVRIETSSKDTYDSTRAFYQSLGMVIEAQLRDFYKPGDDLTIYTCRLV